MSPRYNLAKPKPLMTERYVRKIQANLLGDFEAKSQLKKVFHASVFRHKCANLENTLCKLAARRLVNISLQNSAGTFTY